MTVINAEIEQHLKAGATDTEKLARTTGFLERLDDAVSLSLPDTRENTEKPQKYVKVRAEGPTAAYVYPYGRVELRLEHDDVTAYAALPYVRLIDTVNPWRVDVTLEDAAAVLVAVELTRLALAKAA